MARRLAQRGDRDRGAGVFTRLRRSAAGAASRVMQAAGRAFGRSQVSQRGTILLMVIGVLAMMSMITVIYVTIGQSDRRNAAALAREIRLDDQAAAIADYLAGVVRDDLFTVVEELDLRNNPRIYREAFDYPWMPEEDYIVSIPDPPGATNQIRFTPAGTGLNMTSLSGSDAPRTGIGGDPFLSSTEPARVSTSGSRNFGNLPEALQLVDWPQISNFSPTGLFVNLWALRPEAGGYAAQSGTRGSAGRPALSERLTLFRVNNGAPQPASGTQTLPNGDTADPNVPWHWTRNQVWMHRPAVEIASGPGAPGPDDPEYVPYQYADADGDGMLDSRWFELSQWDEQSDRFYPIIPNHSQARLFVAARCIDLSGLVNVQVAADFEREPTAWRPAGMTPLDVDLRRLLRLKDAYDQFGEVYEAYQQPPVNVAYRAGNYNMNPTVYDAAKADDVGITAYGALRLALRDGAVPPIFSGILQGYGPGSGEPFILDRRDRFDFYRELASASESARYESTPGEYRFASPFGIADELELRTYHGANDPSQTSRFEATVAGREPNPSSTFGDASNLCPVRSNRPLLVERGGRGDRLPATPQAFGANNGLPDTDALLQAATDIRRLLTFFSGARPLRSVELNEPTDPIVGDRNGLSTAITVPGSNPVQPPSNGVYHEVPPQRNEVRLDLATLLEKASPPNNDMVRQEAASQIFAAYARALMPYLGEADAATMWADPTSNNLAKQYRTLFYGHRGPDLAMRIAAHLTANLIDMYDGTSAGAAAADQPTALRVYFSDPTSGGAMPAPIQDYLNINLEHALNQSGLLRPSGATPPPGGVPQELRVYGIEAQPFLTEVAVYHMFVDSPNGDVDYGLATDTNGDGVYNEDEGDTLMHVTINGDVRADNPDFVFQCIAFQVYNPFEFPVNISEYYFEFGNTLFRPGTAIINPGKHEVFFAFNPGIGTVNARLVNAGAPSGTTIQSWVEQQFGESELSLSQRYLRRFDQNGDMIPEGEVRDFFTTDISTTALPEERVVLMWRRFPVDATGYTPTERQTHILADRLRDPATTPRPTWDRRFKLGNLDGQDDAVAGTASGPSQGEGDDSGYAITLFGTVSRPREVTAATLPPGPFPTDPPLGAIPTFCIERKPMWDTTTPSLNTAEDDGVDVNNLKKSDFDPGLSVSRPSLTELLEHQTTTVIDGVNVHEDPKDKVVGKDPSAHAHRLTVATPEQGTAFFRYVEIHLNNDEFGLPAAGGGGGSAAPRGSLLRPADVLLPLGIGPSRIMGVGPMLPDEHQHERSWMTLAEALCLAMGLDHDQNAPASTDPDSPTNPRNPFHRLFEDVLDRGNLRLDWFVAYKDENPEVDDFRRLPVFDPDVDHARYPAVPFAARVIDAFRTTPYGGERRAVPGLLNINTAPLSVLRLLPMFTPLFDEGWTFTKNDTVKGLTGAQGRLFPSTAFSGAVGEFYDIAATAKAYRDKLRVVARTNPTNPGTQRIIDFSDDLSGRAIAQIDGLREDPGFTVPGEILALQIRGRTNPGPNNDRRPTFVLTELGAGFSPNDVNLDCSINRFGFSTLGFDQANAWAQTERTFHASGIDSTSYKNPMGARVGDEIVNDYDEQLAIANAVLGSITTRSDIFCVWFVIHGYLPSDCEALGPNDPLVPSIARRYVMVVDRSNVQRPSDKPRILLFQEVPM